MAGNDTKNKQGTCINRFPERANYGFIPNLEGGM